MAHSVTSPCVGTHDTACMQVCPVNCFYDVPLAELGEEEPPEAEENEDFKKILIIHPEECIDCGLCIPECPVNAIYPNEEVPEEEQKWIDLNANWFEGKDSDQLDEYRITP